MSESTSGATSEAVPGVDAEPTQAEPATPVPELYRIKLSGPLSLTFAALPYDRYTRVEFEGSVIEDEPPALPQGYKRHSDAYGKVGTMRSSPDDPAYTLDYDAWTRRRNGSSMLALLSASRQAARDLDGTDREAVLLEQYSVITPDQDSPATGATVHGGILYRVIDMLGPPGATTSLVTWLRERAGFIDEARIAEAIKSDGPDSDSKQPAAPDGGGSGEKRAKKPRGRKRLDVSPD